MPDLTSKFVPQKIGSPLPSDVDDFVAMLLNSDLTRFLETTYVAVDGTNQTVVRFRLATARLDAELRLALRANGFKVK